MKSSAKKIGFITGSVGKRKKKKKSVRQAQSCPWFDKECEEKRKLFFTAKNRYKLTKNAQNATSRSRASKEYKKVMNLKFRNYQADFIKKLRNLKNSDPRNYWKILNGTSSEKHETSSRISCEVFLEHFKGISGISDDENANAGPMDYGLDGENSSLNRLFSQEEVKTCLRKLKNNKACGIDQVINEFLKAAEDKMLDVFTKFFNVILSSGVVPTEWSIGIVRPLYKNKGNIDDPNNYRGISLLSCFGKLFTSLINNRLFEFLEEKDILGSEQAGFRPGFSAIDHMFTLHCLVDYFLHKKKRLYCAFIDYEKAFDHIERSSLWQKLLASGINGHVLRVVEVLYAKAKSCVRVENQLSNFFQCHTGVRQGENLSPLLFAMYLNDLQQFMSHRVEGLSSMKQEAIDIGIDDSDADILFKMFILLYADDTVICSESPKMLQKALESMSEYCHMWKLNINVQKTKIIVFSRGKIRKLPDFWYRGRKVDIVFDFKYLGLHFSYNNKFGIAQKQLYDKASKAMFALLRKCRKLMLPLDIQIQLFDSMVVPALLYGCEVWCHQMSDLARKLQLRFYKIILKLGKSTPSNMVFGEIGQLPIDVQIKSRMLCFWYSLIKTDDTLKFSNVVYKFFYKLYERNVYKLPFLVNVENLLNGLGLSGVWFDQLNVRYSIDWFKLKVKRCLSDQFMQSWYECLDGGDIFCNYRLFKDTFDMERYLTLLPPRFLYSFVRFRTLNHRLPIQTGRYLNVPRNERLCTMCNSGDLGDEFHYLLVCPHFTEVRKRFISNYYIKHPNAIKFHSLMSTCKKTQLLKLIKFIDVLLKNFKT